jgi:hypothetical protein
MDFRRPDGLCIDGSLICRRDKTRTEQDDPVSISSESVTFEESWSTMLETSQSLVTVADVQTSTAMTTVANGQDQSICHVYGDPHVIRFPAQPQGTQQQYWCRVSGHFQLVSNEFVRIDGRIRNGTWSINEVSSKESRTAS